MNRKRNRTSTSLSPAASIVSSKTRQSLRSGKAITKWNEVGGKKIVRGKPIVSSESPKVIVQSINHNLTKNSNESMISGITGNDIMQSSAGTSNAIIPKSTVTLPKRIELKLGPLPPNVKILRNINIKGFKVLNSSEIAQLQAEAAALPKTTSGETEVQTNSAAMKTQGEDAGLHDDGQAKSFGMMNKIFSWRFANLEIF